MGVLPLKLSYALYTVQKTALKLTFVKAFLKSYQYKATAVRTTHHLDYHGPVIIHFTILSLLITLAFSLQYVCVCV